MSTHIHMIYLFMFFPFCRVSNVTSLLKTWMFPTCLVSIVNCQHESGLGGEGIATSSYLQAHAHRHRCTQTRQRNKLSFDGHVTRHQPPIPVWKSHLRSLNTSEPDFPCGKWFRFEKILPIHPKARGFSVPGNHAGLELATYILIGPTSNHQIRSS